MERREQGVHHVHVVLEKSPDFPLAIDGRMPHALLLRPHLGPDPVERLEGEGPKVLPVECHRRLEDGRDHHPVPGGEDRLVDRGHRPRVAHGFQFPTPARDEAPDAVDRQAEGLADRLRSLVDEEDVLSRVVMHLPALANFIQEAEDSGLLRIHGGIQLF